MGLRCLDLKIVGLDFGLACLDFGLNLGLDRGLTCLHVGLNCLDLEMCGFDRTSFGTHIY